VSVLLCIASIPASESLHFSQFSHPLSQCDPSVISGISFSESLLPPSCLVSSWPSEPIPSLSSPTNPIPGRCSPGSLTLSVPLSQPRASLSPPPADVSPGLPAPGSAGKWRIRFGRGGTGRVGRKIREAGELQGCDGLRHHGGCGEGAGTASARGRRERGAGAWELVAREKAQETQAPGSDGGGVETWDPRMGGGVWVQTRKPGEGGHWGPELRGPGVGAGLLSLCPIGLKWLPHPTPLLVPVPRAGSLRSSGRKSARRL
jgi:hypothetical protein